MFCSSCGKEITDGSIFCSGCGAKVGTNTTNVETNSSEVKTMKLRCKVCNGIMDSEPNKQIIECPYCGSKELIIDSDAVTVEKIRSNTYKEVELERMKNENEKAEKQERKEERESYKKGKFGKVTIVFMVICLIAMIGTLRSKHILAGLIALIQTGLFATSWLMGMQIIKEKKKALYLALAILGFLLIIPYSMMATTKKSEKLDWPTDGIATNIPKPSTKYGSIITNSAEAFYASLDKVSQKNYNTYVDACKKMGYTLESNTDNFGYKAYNEEGYKLDLSYYKSGEYMHINLDAPIGIKKFTWPKSEIAKLIPQSKSNIGKIEWEHDYGFVIYVGNTTQNEFQDYADACADAGFTADYSKGDTYYRANNKDGYHLSLEYKGNNIMSIRLDEPDEEKVETVAEETVEKIKDTAEEIQNVDEKAESTNISEITENSSVKDDTDSSKTLVDGMRPSFKEAMDSYETFYKEYCEFLESYDSSNMDMLTKYTSLMTKAVEMDEKFEAWNEEDLNNAELKYYTEVNMRVINMLSNVNY